MAKFDLKTNEGVLESLKDFAKNAFDPESPLYPMAVVVAENGHTEVISGILDGEPATKDAFSMAIRERVKANNAVRIGYMAEAWSIDSKDDPSIARMLPTGSLEHHPKRKEVIHIIVEDKWGKGAMAVFDINRVSETEATLSLRDEDFRKAGGQYTGRFANFFDTKPETTH